MHKPIRVVTVTLSALFSFVVLLIAPAESAETAKRKKTRNTTFMRIASNDDGEPEAMQTAIVRYESPGGEDGVTVDLIAAVHIGDRSYYEKLNEKFESYDVLLYELVAPKGSRVPRDRRAAANPLSFMQTLPGMMLDLESQLDHIDYSKENFVHADMSPQEIANKMAKRGDDEFTIALGVLADVLRQQNLSHRDEQDAPHAQQVDPAEFFEAMDDPKRLKQMLAEQFTKSGSLEMGLGATLNRLLIKDRNQAAMRVFRKQIASGKKRIGIFYGAAHMPDFERRLANAFELRKTGQQWLTAWDLERESSANNRIAPLIRLLEQLEP